MAAADTSLLNYLGKTISFVDLEMRSRFPEHSETLNNFTRYGLVVAVQIPHPNTPIESALLIQETTGLDYYDLNLIQVLTLL